MNYSEAIKYIESTGKFGINLGLKRIERLCELLGNPERKLKAVHVAGTNGKGSTTTFISNILMEEGYKVGIYTSPYIERFTERIKIGNEEIAEVEVADSITRMVPMIDRIVEEGLDHPTEFEIITAAAFEYFYRNDCDYVVLEVGLGGRLDSTNVVNPLVSVITTISYDHVNILGNTLTEIAGEKAGIIKPGRPVVLYPQHKEAMDVLISKAHQCGSKVYRVEGMKHEIITDTKDGIVFDIESDKLYENIKIKMLGEHQVYNAMTALRCVEVLKSIGAVISDNSIYKGLEHSTWPGRFEIMSSKPYVVLDGGHNSECIEALSKAVSKYFSDKKVHIVCGILKDKNYKDMVRQLCEIGHDFIAVAPNNPRALEAIELSNTIKEFGKTVEVADNMKQAIEIGLDMTKDDEVLLFCGSLYTIGEARSILSKRFA